MISQIPAAGEVSDDIKGNKKREVALRQEICTLQQQNEVLLNCLERMRRELASRDNQIKKLEHHLNPAGGADATS